jgi:tetrahydromethanopterin S-methyltransferase subunit A
MIIVTDHAVDRYQRRKRRLDWTDGEVRQEIANQVRSAIRGKRILDHKPKRFRLYKARRENNMMEPGQKFVHTSDGDVAWIIKEVQDGLLVVTTLSPTMSGDANG